MDNDFKYRDIRLTFAPSLGYPVDEVLRTISVAVYPTSCAHRTAPQVPLIGRWRDQPPTADASPSRAVDEQPCVECITARVEYRTYLMQRLREAATKGVLCLRNPYLSQVKGPEDYESDYALAITSSINQEDLVKFCHNEMLLARFEEHTPGRIPIQLPRSERLLIDQLWSTSSRPPGIAWPAKKHQMALSTAQDTATLTDPHQQHQSSASANEDQKTEQDSPREENYRWADYSQLAKAFPVKDDLDKNLSWFQERCSNPDPSRYKAFAEARVLPGRRGRPGKDGTGGRAAKFDVLSIYAHLVEEDRKKMNRYLFGLKTHFPEAFNEFQAYLDTEKP